MSKTQEISKIIEFIDYIDTLLSKNQYIAKSDYINKIQAYKNDIDFFKVLEKSKMLKEYCQKNNFDIYNINKALDIFNNIDELVLKHNDDYVKQEIINEKEYLDNILKPVDKNVVLDNNQREVIVSDEDYTLVIAGAGAGKTTTVAAKVKYLVEKKNIRPEEILVVSFTNKAVEELKQRINKQLKINCFVSTFHAIGYKIIGNQQAEKVNIVQENKLFYCLSEYIKNTVLTNPKQVENLVNFFATYLDVPYEGEDVTIKLSEIAKANYTTLRGDIEDYKQEIIDNRTKKKTTIQNEIVRSYQEVEIANYLYLNNLDYVYEPIYKYNIKYSNKPYTPDFLIKQGDKQIYLEHFGISQKGENNFYDKEKLDKYKKAINDKVKLHKQHSTKLIYTFSRYNDGRQLLEHLAEELENAGFVLKRKDNNEVLKKIIDTEESRYIYKLVALLQRFIELFKTNGYTVDDFNKFKLETKNVRNHIFLDICKDCYLEYEKYLNLNNAIDFEDMINNSAKILQDMIDNEAKLRFKYIIVDEYQDISKQRFDLVEMLHKVCDAKIVAVGDDWQSIYAFSGSDINLFLDFERKMGYAKQLKIENTYRNSQEVIDIAGNFIQKNNAQIKKKLKSPKHINDPIIIYTYDSSKKEKGTDNKSGRNYQLSLAVEKCIGDIEKYNKEDKKNNKDIMLLGRFNYEVNNLIKSGLFQPVDKRMSKIKSLNYPEYNITFMSAHASKGLGSDNVIILNGANSKFGFPSKIQNDPIMLHVLKDDKTYEYAEERRLFYVAMTRTKNRVFCVAPEEYPSEFLLEIKRDYQKVILNGEWNQEIKQISTYNKCPICGYPLQFKYKNAYGLRLYICTNEPEVCGFMSNDLKGDKLQICKCNQCNDGYLVIKKSSNAYILGCTNYSNDSKGCNNIISKDKYYEMMALMPSTPIINNKTKVQSKDLLIDIKELTNKEISKYNLDKPNYQEIYMISKEILECVELISKKKYLGVNKIAQLLKGKSIDINNKTNYDKVPQFGLLSSLTEKQIICMIYANIKVKNLLKTKEEYPVLHPTIEGRNFLNNKSVETSLLKNIYMAYKNQMKQ